MLGPLLTLICLAVSIAGLIAPIMSGVRHGNRGLLQALAGLPGAALIWAWMMLFIGIMEGTYRATNFVPWILGGVGAAGALLVVLAIRAAVQPRLRPGECPRCPYQCAGLAKCPECGNTRLGQTHRHDA